MLILWVNILGRLTTQDKLLSWGLYIQIFVCYVLVASKAGTIYFLSLSSQQMWSNVLAIGLVSRNIKSWDES